MSGEVKTQSFKINFEAMATDLATKVNEMEAVLAWASEHVKCADGPVFKGDLWDVSTGPTTCFEGPTLYEALHTAWEKCDE